MAGYFHSAAKVMVPDIGEIISNAGSKKSFTVKIGDNTFQLKRLNTVTRLSFIRRLGSMLGEVDDLTMIIARGASLMTKAKEYTKAGDHVKAGELNAEAYSEMAIASPKIVAAVCNPKFEALLVECAKSAEVRGPKDWDSLHDDTVLDEAIDENVTYLIALGLCYLEVNAQDFLKQVVGTIQSRLQQTDVSISTSLEKTTNEQ